MVTKNRGGSSAARGRYTYHIEGHFYFGFQLPSVMVSKDVFLYLQLPDGGGGEV